MLSKKIKWIKVFDSLQDLDHRFIVDHFCYSSNGLDILFIRSEGKILAFKNRCPHQNKPMVGCKVTDGRVVCPYHQYAFSLEDGKGHGLYLEKYPIEERSEGVFVGIEKWSFF